MSLPVVDLSQSEEVVCNTIRECFRNQGFCYLKGFGISDNDYAEVADVINKFFALPENHEAKQGLKNRQKALFDAGIQSGYYPSMHTAKGLDCDTTMPPDAATSHYFFTNNAYIFPDEPIFDLEKKCLKLFSSMQLIGRHMIRLFGKAFGVESWVQDNFICEDHASTFKITQYIVPDINGCSTAEETKIRFLEHEDQGGITIFFPGVATNGGLQVLIDGEFVDVPPIKDHLICNAGALFQRASKGSVKATRHRVRMPTVEELPECAKTSIVYFVQPKFDALVYPHTDSKLNWRQFTADYMKVALKRDF